MPPVRRGDTFAHLPTPTTSIHIRPQLLTDKSGKCLLVENVTGIYWVGRTGQA